MPGQKQITTTQATAVVISTAIGVGVLSLPFFASSLADSSAPLATVLGVVFVLIALALNTVVSLRFSTLSIVQYSEEVFGPWIGRMAGLGIAALFLGLTALAAREFGEIVTTTLLHRTPLEVILTLTLLMAAVSNRHDIATFAYIHSFYLPFILIPAFIMLTIALRYGDPFQVMPLYNGEWWGIAKGALLTASLFQGAFIITVLIPSMYRPRAAWIAVTLGMGIVGLLMVMAVVAALTVLGTEEAKQFFWPTLEVIRSMTLPGEILERIDVLLTIVWVVAVYTTLFSSYHLTVYVLGEIVRLKDHRPFALAVLPLIVGLALLPQDVHQLYRWIGRVGYFIDAASVGYPTIVLILAWLRGKRGRAADEGSTVAPPGGS
ncbi:GerAB/ArcD/ProY family transporter [Kyrpidia spormannii]|uniref:Spore gernimation protein n=1 Tax=Kyrpidia spormannii TaxID=2055160 RepID=A0A6F9E179_9BACL|nr:endospore germination permease [Kyrpidia spormannii]CAB3390240.1 Spore gernimation protein [Kyrpidia spormannii]